MGLDGVEIVMAVEDAFDIQIEDSEAGKLFTPRLLIDHVLGKVATATATGCLTQRAFNQLRKSLLRHGGWKRSNITPAASLSSLMSRDQRRLMLEKVTIELGIKKPPEFIRARWINYSLLIGSVMAGILAAILTWPILHTVTVYVFIGVALFTAGIAIRLTRPLCKEFPKNLQTVGDLARWVMTHKGDLADATLSGWTRDQIAARVREIVVDVLGCKPDFSEDAHFVKDLGVD